MPALAIEKKGLVQALEQFDQLRFGTGFFIFFRQAEHDHRIAGIAGEHLLKDFDSRRGHGD